MKVRIISAIVAILIGVPLLIIGGIWLDILLSVIVIMGLKEINDIYRKERKIETIITLFSYLSSVVILLSEDALSSSICLSIFIFFIPLIFFNNEKYNYKDAVYLFGSTLFISFPFYLLRMIRISSLNEVIFLFLITIMTDTFALIGGKTFGKHKLIERISPNKTIEGSISGSLIGTIIPTIYYIFMIDPGINILFILFLTFLLTIIDQLGDLVFSSIKRYYKIKDFSNIMPGHGGILDRFDSIIFVTIAYTIIKSLFL